jgi:predicted phage tail protein
MLIPVILSGFLAKRFGKRFDMDVRSPREAVRALSLQLKGFDRALLDHKAGFMVWADKELLTESDLTRCTGTSTIRIVPIISGSKSPLASIILGAALMYFAPWANLMYPELGAFGNAMAVGLSGIGASMVLGGISKLLFHPPTPPTPASNGQNYLFNGSVNTTAQGNCVSICYGRMKVGSQLISAGIMPNQLTSTAVSNAPGSNNGFNPNLTVAS